MSIFRPQSAILVLRRWQNAWNNRLTWAQRFMLASLVILVLVLVLPQRPGSHPGRAEAHA